MMLRIRKFHKWLAIAIGLQVFVWVTSGVIISLLDQQIVSGGTTKQTAQVQQTIGEIDALVPLSRLGLQAPEKISSITLRRIGPQLAYQITSEADSLLFDAHSGEVFTITRELAEQNARSSYRGEGAIFSSAWLAEGSDELPDRNSVWRIDFDDNLSTRVYVAGIDGAVLAHRNRYWKIVDFLLMLHFMDYMQEGSFNNIQIIVVGFAALWLAIFGLLLVKTGFTRRDFTWRGLTR